MSYPEVFLKRYFRGLRRGGPALFAATALLLSLACSSSQGDSDVMAKVNGHRILRSEVDKYYANQTAGAPQQPSGEQSTSLKLSILKELIDNEILMQRAEKLGLLATNEEVEQKLNEIKAPYTQEEFDKRLKERQISLEDFKRDLRRSITVEKVMNKEITSKINISDGDISSYYNAHKPEFNLIEPQFHLAHIIVTTAPNPQVRNLKNDKAQNEAEARKKIQTLLNRLDSGEDFATVAMNYSEDPDTAGNGGDRTGNGISRRLQDAGRGAASSLLVENRVERARRAQDRVAFRPAERSGGGKGLGGRCRRQGSGAEGGRNDEDCGGRDAVGHGQRSRTARKSNP
jgi:parvulin-like peptidyl-prolyl isomerase